ncbi:hypothetical protein OEZ85_003131 [Tetradesmus obliquus]|uniref:PDZ domain-containing protein n=1 Tax=Tetradesmus obliquus TaxID=3088 RepID=A0ABY8U3T5_TETOB|nr:hypothetical protein OEZ85_003131 [Tetradesmus obliquus]
MKTSSFAGSSCLQAAAPTTCVQRNALIRAAASTSSSRTGVVAPSFKDNSAPELLHRVQEAVQSGLQKAAAVGVAASLLLSSPAAAEDAPGGRTLLRLPASDDSEVFQAQQTLLEAWSIVGDSFVDDSFNGHYWPDELKQHMLAAFASKDGRAAFHEIETMLGELGDPYTRIIHANEYADFRVSSDGELQGVGLLIANEPYNNHLLVLSAIKGGPADRAGMTTGDEVISINDQPIEGWTGDMAAKLLRGKGGTEVRVRFARRTDGIPGVPGRPEPPLESLETVKEVKLRREKVALSPLYYTALQVPELGTPSSLGITLAAAPPAPQLSSSSAAAPAGKLSSSAFTSSSSSRSIASSPAAALAAPQQPQWAADRSSMSDTAAPGPAEQRLGYLRLSSFSSNAADDMHRAIAELERSGVAGYILDLRDNPGGLVKSGIDIARLLLDGHPTLFAITGRDGEPLQEVTLGSDEDDAPGPAAAAEALTHRPLVVLVNKGSASASEILSGALHDNQRAMIIGDTPTYGKGRIQSVYELHDGSALFVTVAKYVTPAGTQIDTKGIRPDSSCSVSPSSNADEDNPFKDGTLAAFIPGLSIGPSSEEQLAASLANDKCVLTAASVIQQKAGMARATSRLAAQLPRSF